MEIGSFMSRNGALVVRHWDLEAVTGGFWRADGVHLNALSNDLWTLGLQETIDTAVHVWRNAWS